jgi:methylated-DNA-[protein]-cysteine S-methyltransferase
MTIETENLLYTTAESPIGQLLLIGDGETLRGVHIQEGRKPARIGDSWKRAEEPFVEVRKQLDEYFGGERVGFELALAATGSDFERRVWRELEAIPYGETTSYGELAGRIGHPGSARAVGMANGRNPISIIVPCHRVIGADGTLTGYGGGVERKRFLLELEQGTLRLA